MSVCVCAMQLGELVKKNSKNKNYGTGGKGKAVTLMRSNCISLMMNGWWKSVLINLMEKEGETLGRACVCVCLGRAKVEGLTSRTPGEETVSSLLFCVRQWRGVGAKCRAKAFFFFLFPPFHLPFFFSTRWWLKRNPGNKEYDLY